VQQETLVEMIVIKNSCRIPGQLSAVNIQTVSAVNKMMRLVFRICLMFDCLRRENKLEIPRPKFLDESGKINQN
jgi:hypothetical protein